VVEERKRPFFRSISSLIIGRNVNRSAAVSNLRVKNEFPAFNESQFLENLPGKKARKFLDAL
jgi:hypothetical protein